MKRNAIILPLILGGLILLALGCETDRITFAGPYHVRFTDSVETFRESYTQPIQLEVHNAGPQLDKDITVSYSISGSAIEGKDFTIVGDRGTVTIPKNKSFGYITVQLINNSNNILRTQNVIFTIDGTNDMDLNIGQGGASIGRKLVFNIIDDCILGGTYAGQKDALTPPIEDITITSQDCENYVLSNFDIYIFQVSRVRDLKFIDNGDNTITIPDQLEETMPTDSATVNGTGNIDPATRNISMTVKFADLHNQPEFKFTLVRQ